MIHHWKRFKKLYFDEFLPLRAISREGEGLNMRHFWEALAKRTQKESTFMKQDIWPYVAHMAKHCELFAISDIDTGASKCDPAVSHLREYAQYGIHLRVRCFLWASKSLRHSLP